MNCQHRGLKNQRPSIGQVGRLTAVHKVTSQTPPETANRSHGERRSSSAKIGAAVISTT